MKSLKEMLESETVNEERWFHKGGVHNKGQKEVILKHCMVGINNGIELTEENKNSLKLYEDWSTALSGMTTILNDAKDLEELRWMMDYIINNYNPKW
jgi:hypothetical protein